MTRPLDDDLRELLSRRAAVDAHEVAALRRHAATLPSRRASRRGLLAAAASIVLLLSFGGLLVANLPFGTSGAAPSAPDPAAFAGDPRLAVCGVEPKDAIAIFEMAHLRDYPLHLPAAYELMGLMADLEAPTLVIVHRGPGSPNRQGEAALPGSHDLCLVVGSDPASWANVAVVGVDTTGMLAYLPEPTGTPLADDIVAWVDRCGGPGAGILAAVRLDHWTDGAARLVLDPAPPELATDVPAAVIVYDATHPFPPLGTPPADGATIGPREPLAEGRHDLCVLIGADPATAERTLHEDTAVRFVVLEGTSPAPSGSSSPSPSPSPSPAATSTLPAQIDPADCARMKFAEDRCLAVVEAAMERAGLTWAEIDGVSLATLPNTGYLGGGPVAGVTFALRDGTTREQDVVCGGISIYSLVCNDHPRVMLIAATGGYTDVPCGAIPGGEPGSTCATPMPTIAPAAAAAAVPLEIASRDYPIAGLGHQEILVGRAVLPNGILSDGRFSLADPFTRTFTVRGGVTLVVRSLDPTRPPFDNIYAHGWYPGTEEVEVYFVFDVTALAPGARLEIRDLVVR